MLMVIFTEIEQRILEADIRNVKHKLGVSFPEQIVQHYLQYNGGAPDPYCFVIEDGTVLMVQEFLAIKYGNITLEYTYNTLTNNDAPIPVNLIPFASDPGGNYFCFDQDDKGSIYYYDAEHYDDPKRAFRKISNSLDDFLNRLKDEPEDM